MKVNTKKTELLAPAGNFEALKAAIANGADAVYLGLSSFSARAAAANFSIDLLKEAIDYSHLFGVKVYVAINTLIKDNELKTAISNATDAWEAGASAIIVQDFGFARRLKREAPQIVLHASTQMGIHNFDGAIAAKKLGIERVILSRETPLKEIENIIKRCALEVEYFVHGALCCSFSGNCYFSSLISGKSGNRGRCLQLCRKSYLLQEKNKEEQGYWLSTRDTMLIDEIGKLIDIGVCSFKIEGRMRRKEYVAEATRVYRKAIDSYCKVTINGNDEKKSKGETGSNNLDISRIDSRDIDGLKLVYNRGNFSKAHLEGANLNGIIYPLLQSHMGLKIGKVKSVLGTKAILNCRLYRGDGLKFLRAGKEVGHALVLSDGFETGFVGRVIAGDDVHITDSVKNNLEINKRIKNIPLDIIARFDLSKCAAAVTVKSGEKEAEFIYSIPLEIPQKCSINNEDITECLTSLGNTNFECNSICIKSEADFFVQKSLLKQLKRDFTRDFAGYLISSFERENPDNKKISEKRLATQETTSTYQTTGESDFWGKLLPVDVSNCRTIIMCGCEEMEIYRDYADYLVIKPANYEKLFHKIESGKFISDREKYILDLPVISFSDDISLLQKIIQSNTFDKYMINNIYGLNLVKESKIFLGYKMNLLNSEIELPYIKSIETAIDNKLSKGNELNSDLGTAFIYVFGRPDVMQFVHCYYNMRCGCANCEDDSAIFLCDDHNERYEIKRQKIHNCYNLLVSSLPQNLSSYAFRKRFIDVTNLTHEEQQKLFSYLKGNEKCISSVRCLQTMRNLL